MNLFGRISIASLCTMVFVVSYATGQQAPTTNSQPPSDDVVKEYLRVMRIENMVKLAQEAEADGVIIDNPTLVLYRDVIKQWQRKVMSWDVVGPQIVELYKNTFTEQEMQEIMAFYRTSAGQALLDKMPALLRKQREIGDALTKAHWFELKEMISEHAKALTGTQPPTR